MWSGISSTRLVCDSEGMVPGINRHPVHLLCFALNHLEFRDYVPPGKRRGSCLTLFSADACSDREVIDSKLLRLA